MTIEEFAMKIGGIPAEICNRRILYEAATGTMVDVSERVWGRGELTGGGKLVYNEDYEVYGYKPPLPRKPSGKGKPNAKGESKKIKGGYYATYLAMKNQQGRGDHPFELTGDLRLSYLGGAYATPTEVGCLEVHIDLDKESAKKWEGLTATKGEFLALSESEKKAHHQRVLDQYRDLL